MSIKADSESHVAIDDPAQPPRAPRAIEQDYLAALADAVTLDDWREIVREAVDCAKAGDHRAREWLADYVVRQRLLLTLAANEHIGDARDRVIERAAVDQRRANTLDDLLVNTWATVMGRAAKKL